ncbi:PREDICTED: uncharacterized protein LOC105362540 [Ceratosolen solmsi marchali]|uniref:Uncharacterized protein LOC105362540 n=1 Tax=Ceratosolen solmsi marchali TaxID=326594 RepID=A0AAJ6YHQ9_9HYME|nr:PREDICTED: uncharacterized protein LOC105362540 [Ceratosolen solmsi marchali]XP_011498304.1 PREDICTED: uncharacterized protein LOC105362540 [Ceratosolen solmsi marchali]
MKMGLLKTFLYYFQLRQGTILIAILQLVLSGYVMIFFVLGLRHEAGIQNMIARDTEDVLEREALEEITSKHINSHRMELAHHNVTEKVYLIYCGLVIVIVHFVSTLLLLYGALMNNRYLMTPWMMGMMTIIVALIISLFLVQEDCPFIAVIGGRANVIDRLLVLTLALVCLYMWLVVYSTYRYLEIKKGVIHEVHTVNEKKYMRPTTENKKPQRQHVALPQPYDV